MRGNITILGESRFYWVTEANVVWVSHPKWSTVGCGKGLSGAIDNLIDNALIIKDDYVKCEDSELSEEAIKLKHWLASIQKTEAQ